MCCQLEQFFTDSTKANLFSMFVGGAITWLASWCYYKKAGDGLKTETALLKKANMTIAYKLEHPSADSEVKRDATLNPVAFIAAATVNASGKATVKGVSGNVQSDS